MRISNKKWALKKWALVDSDGYIHQWSSFNDFNDQLLIYSTRRRAREVGNPLGLRPVRVTLTYEVKK